MDWRVLDKESLSPHRYIACSIDTGRQAEDTRWIRGPINKRDFQTLLRQMVEQDHSTTPERLIQILKNAYSTSTPRVRTVGGKVPYWWTDVIASLRKEALAARRRWVRLRGRRNTNPQALAEASTAYKASKKKIKSAIATSKRRCWESLINDLENDAFGDGYKLVRRGMNVKYPVLDLGPEDREREIAALFPQAPVVVWPRYDPEIFTPFTMEELNTAAAKLKSKRAPGRDGVPPDAVKAAVETIGEYILEVYNGLASKCIFPRVWKKASVVLVEKPKKVGATRRSFRPICLIDCIGKLYELLIVDRLTLEIEIKGGFSDQQYGFRKKRSTLQAVEQVLAFSKTAHRSSPCQWSAVALLDIRNAFNTASWTRIIDELDRRGVAQYIGNIIKDYLTDRFICYGNNISRAVNVGVPQGSILGPTLWNVLYDGVLRLRLPSEVRLVAFADDLAVVVADKGLDMLVEKMNRVLHEIHGWLNQADLQMAPEKTEVLLFRYGRRKTAINLEVGGATIASQDRVRYLGVTLDAAVSFGPHIRATATKAEETVRALSILMPNIGGPGERSRRMLSQAAQSILLYAAPVWAGAMRTQSYRKIYEAVQRRLAIRICSGYRTLSFVGSTALASLIPIHILVEERKELYDSQLPKEQSRKICRNNSLNRWQEEWSTGINAAWTRKLIPDIRPWVRRGHGPVNYHLTQALSGHGEFGSYLLRIGKRPNDECRYCNAADSPEHTFFHCTRWSNERRRINTGVGTILRPSNLVNVMLRDGRHWSMVSDFIKEIMETKERDGR